MTLPKPSKLFLAAIPSNIVWSLTPRMSTEKVTCYNCQRSDLSWAWNFTKRKPELVDHYRYPHDCPTPKRQDIFPGWCLPCNSQELYWLRKNDKFELTESYGLPHTCEQDEDETIHDITHTHCKYCKTPNLLWVVRKHLGTKFTLTHANGDTHFCQERVTLFKDWSEALRMNYAFEKNRLKSIPDGTVCKPCKGEGSITTLSKNKRLMARYRSTEPVQVTKQCLKCKRIGTFSKEKKAFYLKQLRMKYWPYKGGVHKWKKVDQAS